MNILKILSLSLFLLLQPSFLFAVALPLHFTDSAENEFTIISQPKRVVSLVPSVTEMIIGIGAGESLVGNTHHSLIAAKADKPTIVGGFFSPDLDMVESLNPDIIFYSSVQKGIIGRDSSLRSE